LVIWSDGLLAPPMSAPGELYGAVDHVQLAAVDEPDQQQPPVAGRDHGLGGRA